mmetsp:Transcript_37436/g.120979  ORF Transcript_37436/g.120979 Transcript_37436/m.120979 type:complete len:317 (+) Transcript_37436:221-1171(+)
MPASGARFRGERRAVGEASPSAEDAGGGAPPSHLRARPARLWHEREAGRVVHAVCVGGAGRRLCARGDGRPATSPVRQLDRRGAERRRLCHARQSSEGSGPLQHGWRARGAGRVRGATHAGARRDAAWRACGAVHPGPALWPARPRRVRRRPRRRPLPAHPRAPRRHLRGPPGQRGRGARIRNHARGVLSGRGQRDRLWPEARHKPATKRGARRRSGRLRRAGAGASGYERQGLGPGARQGARRRLRAAPAWGEGVPPRGRRALPAGRRARGGGRGDSRIPASCAGVRARRQLEGPSGRVDGGRLTTPMKLESVRD